MATDYQREWRESMMETDPERIRDYSRRYRQRQREKKLEQQRMRRNARAANRRGHEREATGSFTTHEWFSLVALYGNKCLACGASKDISIDHVVPLSKGGTNDITNLQPLCRACNSSKGTNATDYRPAIAVNRQRAWRLT
jgi:5-methylcytosine-specific restriction endonuclease McrA